MKSQSSQQPRVGQNQSSSHDATQEFDFETWAKQVRPQLLAVVRARQK